MVLYEGLPYGSKEKSASFLIGLRFRSLMTSKPNCNNNTLNFYAKFRVGVCHPLFQNGPLARPFFGKMIPLAWLD